MNRTLGSYWAMRQEPPLDPPEEPEEEPEESDEPEGDAHDSEYQPT